jgi:hypothetical protein
MGSRYINLLKTTDHLGEVNGESTLKTGRAAFSLFDVSAMASWKTDEGRW